MDILTFGFDPPPHPHPFATIAKMQTQFFSFCEENCTNAQDKTFRLKKIVGPILGAKDVRKMQKTDEEWALYL